MSPANAFLWARNLRMMSMIFSDSAGPVYKQSFKETPFDLQDAS